MDFFMIENGKQTGPMTIAQLAERHITSETLVWREGMADWKPAWKVPELRYILEEQHSQNAPNQQGEGPAVPPIPPSYREGRQQEYASSQGSQTYTPRGDREPRPKQPSHHLGLKIVGGLIIALLIVLMLTNPSKEDHENAIRTEVSKAIDKSDALSGNDIFSQGFKMMARMVAGSVLDSALDQLFEYHSYLFFSKGTVTLDGKSHTISYGLFGKVMTMNADDMVKALEKDHLQVEESSSTTSSDDSGFSQPNDNQDEGNESMDEAAQTDNNASDGSIQQRLEDKTNDAVDKVKDKVRKKVEDKINQKIDEVTDSSTIEKLIDKILGLF